MLQKYLPLSCSGIRQGGGKDGKINSFFTLRVFKFKWEGSHLAISVCKLPCRFCVESFLRRVILGISVVTCVISTSRFSQAKLR